MKNRFRTNLVLFACLSVISGAAVAESYDEFATTWFINPVNPQYSCAAGVNPPGGCKPSPAHLTFTGAHLMKLLKSSGYRAYFYVQVWGALQGPGGECDGDDILLFEAPYSHQGVRGQGVTYYGPVSPCDIYHWNAKTVFWDPHHRGVVISALRQVSGNDFKHLFYGLSKRVGGLDDGHNFDWFPLVSATNSSVDFNGAYLLPHPTVSGLLFGGLSFRVNSGPWRTALMEVDWIQNEVKIKTASGWVSTTIGGGFNQVPASVWNQRPFHLADVGNDRYEFWSNKGGARSGNTPCSGGATTQYGINTSSPGAGNSARGNSGSDAVYAQLSNVLSRNYTVSGTRQVSSSSSASENPADYSQAYAIPTRFEVPGTTSSAVYTGSTDASICNYDLANWNPWSGMGIKFRAVNLIP